MAEFNESGTIQHNQIKSEYKFDTSEYNPHGVKQLAAPLEKIKLNKMYLNTVLGILRIVIIVIHFHFYRKYN